MARTWSTGREGIGHDTGGKSESGAWRTASLGMKLSPSTLVSRAFQGVGNSACSFHGDETFSLILLLKSWKYSFFY
jgi:hypothetical protein